MKLCCENDGCVLAVAIEHYNVTNNEVNIESAIMFECVTVNHMHLE